MRKLSVIALVLDYVLQSYRSSSARLPSKNFFLNRQKKRLIFPLSAIESRGTGNLTMRNGLYRVLKSPLSGINTAEAAIITYYILHSLRFLDFIITHQARHYVKISNTEKIIYIFIYYI